MLTYWKCYIVKSQTKPPNRTWILRHVETIFCLRAANWQFSLSFVIFATHSSAFFRRCHYWWRDVQFDEPHREKFKAAALWFMICFTKILQPSCKPFHVFPCLFFFVFFCFSNSRTIPRDRCQRLLCIHTCCSFTSSPPGDLLLRDS